MKIAAIRADDARGPGHAEIQLDNSSADQLDLTFFDVDRREYLWPSSGRITGWGKQPHYFPAFRVNDDPPVFRIGPEVCNYLETDSLLQISSRDGALDHSEIVWPGVPTLGTSMDVVPFISDDPIQAPNVTYLPVLKAPRRPARQAEIIPKPAHATNSMAEAPEGKASPELRSETALAASHLEEGKSNSSPPSQSARDPVPNRAPAPSVSPAETPKNDTEIAQGSTGAGSDELRRWLLVFLGLIGLVVVLIAISSRSSPATSDASSPQGYGQPIGSDFRFTGFAGGPFEPRQLQLKLTRLDVGQNWSIAHLSSRIQVTPDHGELSEGSSMTLTIIPREGAFALPRGWHSEPFEIQGSTRSARVSVVFSLGSK